MGAAMSLLVTSAEGGNRFAYEPAAIEMTRAHQYASASALFCFMELEERGVPFERLDAVRGVAAPLRLTGPVRGVMFTAAWADIYEAPSEADVLDCPLALAIDDLASVLADRDVVSAEYLSLYRHGRFVPGKRHPAGRAVDISAVELSDGTRFSVHEHFFGRVGHQTCGAGADPPRREHPGAEFWRDVSCRLDALGSFNLVLTPNYDRGHRDHLHLEVRSGVSWRLTQ